MKIKFTILLLLFACPLFAKHDRIDEYLRFLESNKARRGTFGDYQSGEIEIVRDKKKIREIEELQERLRG